MHPDHEADELETLLHEEYSAPRLDKQFSADLIVRLQAEAAALPSPSRAKPRRSLLAICLGVAAVAASVIAVVWILNRETPGTNHELAQRPTATSSHSTLVRESESQENPKDDRVDHLSVSPRSLSLSDESESIPSLSESLSARSASESKYSRESLAPRKEHLATEERPPSPTTTLSVLSSHFQEWPNILAAVAHADMLYIVDSGRLYEVRPSDGSRRRVGNDNWQTTAAMGATGGHLYLVSGNQLYEVNPKTGSRRSLGKPDWANTKAIVTVSDKLYIASNGQLYRVNPRDGSREVLHSTNDRPNNPRQPKP